MSSAARLPVGALTLFLLLPGSCPAAAPPPPTTEQLIDALARVAQSDYGYSPSVTGGGFLPLHREGQLSMGLLFQRPPVRSSTLQALVLRGAEAVPHLIAHLDDRRPTGVVITHEGFFGGMYLHERVDYNPRTQEARLPILDPQPGSFEAVLGGFAGTKHTVTVGDLCYVALGQIVNRHFNAVRYQPTAIIIISSPTRSPALYRQVSRDWKGLTPLEHSASLINDFIKPDHDSRRTEAAWRLAYYYPEYLEPLALAFLAQRAYPRDAVHRFVRNTLYRTRDRDMRQELFDDFVGKHGQAAREGILLQLFEDLATLEAHEERRHSPAFAEFDDEPRTLLIELYGKHPKVRSTDGPPYPEAVSDVEKARFIEEALIYDTSAKLDRAVLALLRSSGENDYLARACIKRLVGRGHDADIERHCRRRLEVLRGEEREPYVEALDKLGYTPLHVAVEQGNTERVVALLTQGARPDAQARNGKTPLHLAAEQGMLDLVGLLADSRRGLDVKDAQGRTAAVVAVVADHDQSAQALVRAGCAVTDVRVAALAGQANRVADLLREKPDAVSLTTRSKRSPLDLAAGWGHADVLAVLLRHKAALEALDAQGATALHRAAACGQREAARVLLAHKADVRAKLPGSGVEPIHLAVAYNHHDLVQLLAEHKADLNARTTEKELSPLHLAVKVGNREILTLLAEKGADINIRDKEGATPLYRAVEAGKPTLVAALVRHGADVKLPLGDKGPAPIHVAAESGSDTLVELLLRAGAGVEAREPGIGWTPLHKAAAGNGAVVRLLLARRATVDARDVNDYTPLHYAAAGGHEAVVAMLLKARASVRASNSDGSEPIHLAAASGSVPTVLRLLDAGAPLQARTNEGDTPLHLAVTSEQIGPVEVLLARRADVRARNNRGETPLHRAIQISGRASLPPGSPGQRVFLAPNCTRLVSLLLEHKAAVNAADGNGLTPLHRAAQADDIDLVRLLLSRKADPALKDSKGRTPLDVAVAEKNTRVAELLRRFTPEK